MFFPDEAASVAAFSQHVSCWSFRAHAQRRPTRRQFTSSERTKRL
jgi:hypothetical protein